MKNLTLSVIALATLAMPFTAKAAKPVKITPGNNAELNGERYRNYLVECSNGKNQSLTSWEGGKRWCIGSDSQNDCAKKQIKAAKNACKA